jgi:putative proteasome-type protease
MTYCVAIRVDSGLVFAADTRTSASVDDVRTYNKVHTFEFPGERVLVLMSAGNLGTTQAVLERIQRDMEGGGDTPGLRNLPHLFDAAEYVGDVSVRVQKAAKMEGDFRASWIVGGQIGGQPPGIYMVYAEGNCISCSPETPYLQIGEHKYGKPILDRVIRAHTTLDDAARCALVSLDSTMKSNISVGPPLDLAVVPAGALRVARRLRLHHDTPWLLALRKAWGRNLLAAFRDLPRFEWEARSRRPRAPRGNTIAERRRRP